MEKEYLEIVLEYKNLVYKIGNYFKNYPNKEDLYQVGFIGLINAYKKYDNTFNTKFSTYAYQYIIGEMYQYIKKDKPIKIPRHISKLNLMIEKANLLLSQRLMRNPSIKELASYLEIDEALVSMAMKTNNLILSLDQEIDEDLSLHEVISNDNNFDKDMMLDLLKEVSNLTKPEQYIIKARYIYDLTQAKTANSLGISQVQLSRSEKKILMKLKDKLVK